MRTQRSTCFHSDGSAPSLNRTMLSLTYWLSVRCSMGPGMACAATTAANNSLRCAVCGPCAGPTQ
eukprot:7256247-Lingulodinium_polyedra.AAC.1